MHAHAQPSLFIYIIHMQRRMLYKRHLAAVAGFPSTPCECACAYTFGFAHRFKQQQSFACVYGLCFVDKSSCTRTVDVWCMYWQCHGATSQTVSQPAGATASCSLVQRRYRYSHQEISVEIDSLPNGRPSAKSSVASNKSKFVQSKNFLALMLCIANRTNRVLFEVFSVLLK